MNNRTWVKKRILKLTFSLTVIIFLAACGSDLGVTLQPSMPPSPTIVPNLYEILDGGFISGEPCGPPCFLGITAEDDLESAINKLQGVGALTEECVITNSDIRCLNYAIYFPTTGDENAIGVAFNPEDITLSDVIDKYHEPDEVWVWFPDDDGGWKGFSALNICYSIINVMVVFEQQKPNDFFYEALPTTKVLTVGYQYDSELYCGGLGAQEWHGYGIYGPPP